MLTDLSIRIVATIQTAIAMLHDEERGQDTLEWVLMGGLIAVGIMAVMYLFGGTLQDMVQNVGYCLDFTNSTTCSPGP